MKVYLIVALFLGALVVAHSLEEEEEKVELPEQDTADLQDETEEDMEDTNDQDETEEDSEDTNDLQGGGGEGTEGDMEESDDEEEKRRVRNVLSAISCLRLKQRGYCRHGFIRNLCRVTCQVKPPCRDRLSRISCLRIRAYRKCGLTIGRLYCRRTCSKCGVSPRDPCRNYKVLNQQNRRKSKPRGNVLLCDKKGFATRWYRFAGAAGNRMPTKAPPKNRCGTHAPGWLRGSYPVRRGQIVSGTVCYHWSKKTCNWSNSIRIKNCGRYFVFYLRPTPVCNLRYCGNA